LQTADSAQSVDPSGKLSPLLDSALGIELPGVERTTDAVYSILSERAAQGFSQSSIGLLPCTHNDRVHRQQARFAVDRHVQTLIVNALVLHPRKHLDAVVLEVAAVNPTSRFT